MWHNIKKNHFLVISGFETLILGAYLTYVQHIFIPPDNLPMPEMARIVAHAQDPWITITMVAVGVLTIITGLWDMNRFKAKRVSIASMVAIWLAYFVAFIYHDLINGSAISLGTILIAFLLIRLFSEALWGDEL
ncbi:hypothetical protein IWT140_01692 [Secundilactobacillus pentosiphilus]|uniref:Uncharacterized protein n=1 Tax=Secundilactobacillus pentosiphilus TaxID=1714682 RepID=A0A1Z5IQK9_9LACO|nr:hypothetical protein [Secundilactobacillus pentosiphilus]GAX04055.1 hypothetical protein IWT140_01692 [Secundilactobacillus pentosiphilus]